MRAVRVRMNSVAGRWLLTATQRRRSPRHSTCSSAWRSGRGDDHRTAGHARGR